MASLIGQTIKGYEFREQAGAGGAGAVFRCFQPSLGREVAGRPVVIRPLDGLVVRVAAVVKDVPLGDAQVFEQVSEGVGQARRIRVDVLNREVLDRAVEAHMRLLRREQVDKLLAKR